MILYGSLFYYAPKEHTLLTTLDLIRSQTRTLNLTRMVRGPASKWKCSFSVWSSYLASDFLMSKGEFLSAPKYFVALSCLSADYGDMYVSGYRV